MLAGTTSPETAGADESVYVSATAATPTCGDRKGVGITNAILQNWHSRSRGLITNSRLTMITKS